MSRTRIVLLFVALLGASVFLSQSDIPIQRGYSLSPDWLSGHDRLVRLEILNRVLYHIKESYVDPERVKPEEMFKKALDNISLSVAEVRVLYPSPKRAILVVDQERKEFDTDLPTLYGVQSSISEALRFVKSHKRSDISDDDLETTAINGILSTLDPHSVYLTKEMYREMKTGTSGIFGGLGIEIGIREEKLTVIRPIKDTPAYRAGLQPGDRITRIGEDSTRNMPLDEAVDRMRGPKGTKVTITISRNGWNTDRDFTLTRDEINVVSVESELLPGRIAYVRIKSFQKNTSRDLSASLKRLHERAGGALRGIVLDLRFDPGGLLDQAIAVTDKFLKNGVIVTTVDMATKLRKQEIASGHGTETKVPMVVLVNGSSASASEIVAGALQRQNRALVIGEKTFGKGTVQSIFDLPEKSALKLTVAKYLTPGDISIQSIGIDPEIRTLPAAISPDRIAIFPNHSRISERTLERHFENPEAARAVPPPILSLRYLEERTDKEIVQDDMKLSAVKEDASAYAEGLLRDFSVRLSSEILRTATGPARKEMISAAKRATTVIERQEEEKIRAALQKRGIDWAETPKTAPKDCGTPTATTKIVDGSAAKLRAGDTIRFLVTIDNPGPCPLFQAWANSKSRNYLFDDHEFLFGGVPPGSSVTREVKVEIPKSFPTHLSPVTIEFREAHGLVPRALRTSVGIASAPAPQFAFNYDIRDLEPTRGKRTPPNGLIEAGETVELRVRVRNVGPVVSSEGAASIHQVGEKTVDLRRAYVPIPILQPKEETAVSFLIDVSPSFNLKSFDLDLAVADVSYRVYVTKRLSLNVVSGREVQSRPRVVVVQDGEAPVYALPLTDSPVIAHVSKGLVLHSPGSFDDYYRISLTGKVMAWIQKTSVSTRRPAKPTSESAGIEWTYFQAPMIRTDLETKAFAPIDSQFISFSGDVQDPQSVKDLFVFVNQKKVFYQNLSEGAATGKERKFSATIPLEPGSNRIVVVARGQNDLLQRKALILERTGAPATSDGRSEEFDEFLFESGY
ncbi:MAG: MXAN_5808 family serine peptidase [Pseudomonadota bacterium]